MNDAVRLRPRGVAPGELLGRALRAEPAGVGQALELAVELGEVTSPTVVDCWETLATLAAQDLGVARAVEPHLDALAILSQAGHDSTILQRDELTRPARTWGVFAAEGGGDPLLATQNGSSWSLTGTKPWCSLAHVLDAALVTAQLPDGSRSLFAVDLRHTAVRIEQGSWHARGLVEIPSGPVHFGTVPAVAVGEPGWYLERSGFAWGGIGVAACWWGGAVGVARTVFTAATRDSSPDTVAMHLGAIDALLHGCAVTLADAAQSIDAATATDGAVLAKRVRRIVAGSCEEILVRSGHALGPAPLALDEAHAKRVADLQLYVRQHHAERDDVSLGRALAAREQAPW